MSKMNEIQARIADLRAELDKAQGLHSKNAMSLAMANGDNRLIESARYTAQQCANLRTDLELLEEARTALIAQRDGQDGSKRRAQASELLATVKTLMETRNQAAAEVDQALAGLRQAIGKWTDISTQAHAKAGAFYRALFEGDHEGLQRHAFLSGGLSDAAANALAAQIDEALCGVNTSATIAFNYVQQRHDRRELVVDAAKSSASTVLADMETVARGEAVLA